MEELTQGFCNQIFIYKDGNLVRKQTRSSRAQTGKIVGNIAGGRLVVNINKSKYSVAKIIFLMHYGYTPEFIDHIDRNAFNNKIDNLRVATRTENNRNRSKAKNKSSKYLGVCKSPNKFKKWIACIVVNKVKIRIGGFYEEDKAALAYNKFAVKHFGDFANLNIIKPSQWN